ncbi:MAG: hypothetical protein ACTSPD_15230 [Promethearchaeota archaeon]
MDQKLNDFLRKFKDKSKKQKKSIQTNLDKHLLINTKILEKTKDFKAFDRNQMRLIKYINNEK